MLGLHEYTSQLKIMYCLINLSCCNQTIFLKESPSTTYSIVRCFSCWSGIVKQHQSILEELKLYTLRVFKTIYLIRILLLMSHYWTRTRSYYGREFIRFRRLLSQSVQQDRQYISSAEVTLILTFWTFSLKKLMSYFWYWSQYMGRWARKLCSSVMRYLHTLKGGANMVQATVRLPMN